MTQDTQAIAPELVVPAGLDSYRTCGDGLPASKYLANVRAEFEKFRRAYDELGAATARRACGVSEMVERVARALMERDGVTEVEAALGRYKGDARAAIAAMRVPTDAMRNPALEYARDAAYNGFVVQPDTMWRNMISAALEDRP